MLHSLQVSATLSDTVVLCCLLRVDRRVEAQGVPEHHAELLWSVQLQLEAQHEVLQQHVRALPLHPASQGALCMHSTCVSGPHNFYTTDIAFNRNMGTACSMIKHVIQIWRCLIRRHSPKTKKDEARVVVFGRGCRFAAAAGQPCPGGRSTWVSSWSSGQCQAEEADWSQARNPGLLSATSACSLRWNQSSMERLCRRRWRDLFRHMSWHHPATCALTNFAHTDCTHMETAVQSVYDLHLTGQRYRGLPPPPRRAGSFSECRRPYAVDASLVLQ